jgi:hypothetical protein
VYRLNELRVRQATPLADILIKMTNRQAENNDRWSGTITFDNDEIVFRSQNVELKRLSLTEIKVIGEMTTQADAMSNDWYFVFVDKGNDQHYIPTYANGMQEFLKQLGDKLGMDIVGTLFSSTNFDSNILYPKELAMQKLLDFTDATPKNIWEKLGKIFGFGKPIEAHLTKTVKEHKNVS